MREIVFFTLMALSVPLVLKRPFWGITIYLGALIIRPEMLFWGTTKGSFLFKLYYILIVVGLLLKNDFRKFGRAMQREFLLMIWFLVAILLSVLFAQYPVYREYYYVFELIKGFGICALLYLVIEDFSDIVTLQNALLGCFTFMAIWGIEQQLRGNERLEGLGGSAWGDSNGVAAMFILYLPVALAKLFTSEKKKDFLLSLLIVALMVTLVVCTKSRAGLIGLIASFGAFAYYSRKSAKVAQLSLVLLLVAAPFATKAYIDRMETMKGAEDFQGSVQDRATLWKAGLMVFGDNPLFGTGFLTYPEAKMKYENRFLYLRDEFRAEIFREEAKKVTHNTYIQLLSDCGIVGAIPFILLVGGGIYRGLQARRLLGRESTDRVETLWLAGIGGGITGFGVCILSIDASLSLELYVQLILSAILYRRLAYGHHDKRHVDTPASCGWDIKGTAA